MHRQNLHRQLKVVPSLISCVLTALLLLTVGSAPTAAQGPCPQPDELVLNTTFRSSGSTEASRACYRLVIQEPGFLTLDASAPGSPEAEPRLQFLGSDGLGPYDLGLDDSRGDDLGKRALEDRALENLGVGSYRLIEQSPRRVIVEVETPGTFFLTVASEDPLHDLVGHKLRNAFVEKETANAPRVVFCEPLLHQGPSGPISSTPRRRDDNTFARSVDEEECEILELNSGNHHPERHLFVSCERGEVDDHGDTPLCATPLAMSRRLDPPRETAFSYFGSQGMLGTSVTGTLWNTPGDDEDFFTFDLDQQRTVEMKVLEAPTAHLTLYDAQGLRLGASTPPARLVKTLPAGRYDLRVQNLWGSEEVYSLTLKDLHEP